MCVFLVLDSANGSVIAASPASLIMGSFLSFCKYKQQVFIRSRFIFHNWNALFIDDKLNVNN